MVPSRFQFSIRTMLVATAAVAAGIATVRANPSAASAVTIDCLSLVFATIAILGIMQTSGSMRAFWVGAAVPLNLVAVFALQSAVTYWPWIGHEGDPLVFDRSGLDRWFETQHDLWPFWCAAPINGLLATVFRWLLWSQPVERGQHSENQFSK